MIILFEGLLICDVKKCLDVQITNWSFKLKYATVHKSPSLVVDEMCYNVCLSSVFDYVIRNVDLGTRPGAVFAHLFHVWFEYVDVYMGLIKIMWLQKQG